MIGLASKWAGTTLGILAGACGLAVAGPEGAVLVGTTGYFLGKTADSVVRVIDAG